MANLPTLEVSPVRIAPQAGAQSAGPMYQDAPATAFGAGVAAGAEHLGQDTATVGLGLARRQYFSDQMWRQKAHADADTMGDQVASDYRDYVKANPDKAASEDPQDFYHSKMDPYYQQYEGDQGAGLRPDQKDFVSVIQADVQNRVLDKMMPSKDYADNYKMTATYQDMASSFLQRASMPNYAPTTTQDHLGNVSILPPTSNSFWSSLSGAAGVPFPVSAKQAGQEFDNLVATSKISEYARSTGTDTIYQDSKRVLEQGALAYARANNMSPQETEKFLQGRVTDPEKIDAAVDQKTRQVEVQATINDKAGKQTADSIIGGINNGAININSGGEQASVHQQFVTALNSIKDPTERQRYAGDYETAYVTAGSRQGLVGYLTDQTTPTNGPRDLQAAVDSAYTPKTGTAWDKLPDMSGAQQEKLYTDMTAYAKKVNEDIDSGSGYKYFVQSSPELSAREANISQLEKMVVPGDSSAKNTQLTNAYVGLAQQQMAAVSSAMTKAGIPQDHIAFPDYGGLREITDGMLETKGARHWNNEKEFTDAWTLARTVQGPYFKSSVNTLYQENRTNGQVFGALGLAALVPTQDPNGMSQVWDLVKSNMPSNMKAVDNAIQGNESLSKQGFTGTNDFKRVMSADPFLASVAHGFAGAGDINQVGGVVQAMANWAASKAIFSAVGTGEKSNYGDGNAAIRQVGAYFQNAVLPVTTGDGNTTLIPRISSDGHGLNINYSGFVNTTGIIPFQSFTKLDPFNIGTNYPTSTFRSPEEANTYVAKVLDNSAFYPETLYATDKLARTASAYATNAFSPVSSLFGQGRAKGITGLMMQNDVRKVPDDVLLNSNIKEYMPTFAKVAALYGPDIAKSYTDLYKDVGVPVTGNDPLDRIKQVSTYFSGWRLDESGKNFVMIMYNGPGNIDHPRPSSDTGQVVLTKDSKGEYTQPVKIPVDDVLQQASQLRNEPYYLGRPIQAAAQAVEGTMKALDNIPATYHNSDPPVN